MKGYLPMNKENKRRFAPITTSALGAVSLGIIVKNYVKQKSERVSILQKLKDAEQKLYNDGWSRAKEIESIKKEVHNKILQ